MTAVPRGPNLVPGRYRGVAVARAPGPYDAATLRARFTGREAYWKTRFLVVRPPVEDEGGGDGGGGPVALLAVTRADPDALFSPITAVEPVAGPEECAFLVRPDVDTAIPSALAAAATEAPGARAVVVQGRYEHVNFIVDPRPLRVVVREVVPPHPAKLADQAGRILAVTEDLPPIALETRTVDIGALAGAHPSAHYLLPCRAGGDEVAGAAVSYLDERPPEADWTLVGCARSRQIHHWFYGRDAPGADMCPKADLAADASADDASDDASAGLGPDAVLTKCCLQQEDLDEGVVQTAAGPTPWVSVPWGSSLDHVRDALGRLAHRLEPAWSPA